MRLVYNPETHLAPNIQTVVSQSGITNNSFNPGLSHKQKKTMSLDFFFHRAAIV